MPSGTAKKEQIECKTTNSIDCFAEICKFRCKYTKYNLIIKLFIKKKIVILKKISRMLKITSISGDMQRCGDCLAQKKRLVYVLTINLWTKMKQITDIIPFIVITSTYPRAPLCRWHWWWCNTKTTKIIQKQQSWPRVHKSVQEWRGDTRTVVITSQKQLFLHHKNSCSCTLITVVLVP